ncbi:glutamine amidotransferase [Azorhizobium caulinodans ORS 571]|uniref:Glutamine amidotransferase n=1 Tax=Azorhizobium caulinodans (strain ATCC 43989 / DSM 5975 / JCM 20966 / LMG 6465 / NBRC 14845 / NCIMB 13405 / ORS 571) TaxID=438753 RepID=A8I1E5_AZOC5|nr:class II glutamine amidotransferase [Azorhizobium caulinodans]BAF87364.1 glutamine amidotransferase [Azorhizobium caulinodans ORS 571]
MCRWMAYSGEPIALDRYVTRSSHSLVVQSQMALESTMAMNGDGFGLGWYDDLPEPGLYREIRPAWSDDNLRSLSRHLKSRLFFAHVRAATGTPVTRPNCHPFAHGRWLFMHNGYLANWTSVRREVEALIPDEIYGARAGSTDSEALFLALLGQGLADGAGESPIGAVTRLLETITALAGGEPFLFTAALSDGVDLHAFRYGVNAHANSLYYRAAKDGVLIASEPLDDDRATWLEVPPQSALSARSGHDVEVMPLPLSRRPHEAAPAQHDGAGRPLSGVRV